MFWFSSAAYLFTSISSTDRVLRIDELNWQRNDNTARLKTEDWHFWRLLAKTLLQCRPCSLDESLNCQSEETCIFNDLLWMIYSHNLHENHAKMSKLLPRPEKGHGRNSHRSWTTSHLCKEGAKVTANTTTISRQLGNHFETLQAT